MLINLFHFLSVLIMEVPCLVHFMADDELKFSLELYFLGGQAKNVATFKVGWLVIDKSIARKLGYWGIPQLLVFRWLD